MSEELTGWPLPFWFLPVIEIEDEAVLPLRVSTRSVPDPDVGPYGRPGSRLWVKEPFWITTGKVELGGDTRDPSALIRYSDWSTRVTEVPEEDGLKFPPGLSQEKKRWTSMSGQWASRFVVEIGESRLLLIDDLTEEDVAGRCGKYLAETYGPLLKREMTPLDAVKVHLRHWTSAGDKRISKRVEYKRPDCWLIEIKVVERLSTPQKT